MERADESTWVTEELLIAAPPETVFEFFVDPLLMASWMGNAAVLEPRPGGIFAVDIGSNQVRGQYLLVEAPERVVFTWGWEGSEGVPPGSSTVTFTFEPVGEGTRLRMVHEGLSPEEAARHTHGWAHYLGRLTVAAPGGEPGPDPHIAGRVLHESQS